MPAEQAEREARLKAERAAWEKELDGWTHETDAYSVEISGGRATCTAADAARTGARDAENAMVSTDIGNICSVSNSYLRFDAPRSMLAAMSFGNCATRSGDLRRQDRGA